MTELVEGVVAGCSNIAERVGTGIPSSEMPTSKFYGSLNVTECCYTCHEPILGSAGFLALFFLTVELLLNMYVSS